MAFDPILAKRCAHETVGNMIAKTAIRRRSKVRFCIFILLMVPDVKGLQPPRCEGFSQRQIRYFSFTTLKCQFLSSEDNQRQLFPASLRVSGLWVSL
jgi:hypothetical protein